MKHKSQTQVLLKYAEDSMRALEKHAQELKQEWQGKLVELEDMHGYTGDGQVADIHVEYLCYEHWFKDKKCT